MLKCSIDIHHTVAPIALCFVRLRCSYELPRLGGRLTNPQVVFPLRLIASDLEGDVITVILMSEEEVSLCLIIQNSECRATIQ